MSKQHLYLSDQARRRLMAGDLILRGYDNDEIVDILDVSNVSVKRWRKNIKNGGLHALARKSQSGRPQKLDDAKRHELKIIIRKGARASAGILEIRLTDRWTSRIVADLIDKKWGVRYSCSQVRCILRSLALTCQKPDVEAAEHSSEAVEHWRHYDWPRIKKKRTPTDMS